MKIRAITPNGILVCDFDQDLMSPDKIDQKIYNSVFRLKVMKDDSETASQGGFVGDKKILKP
jgi:hypothetical protein